MRKIEITDVETGEKAVYTLSNVNWAKRWACMSGNLVVMWVPRGLAISPNAAIRTSGRIWRVL